MSLHLFWILPAPKESGRVIAQTRDGRAALGYLGDDGGDLVARLEAIRGESEVDHVRWRDQFAGPVHHFAVVAFHVNLQEDVRIDPAPRTCAV